MMEHTIDVGLPQQAPAPNEDCPVFQLPNELLVHIVEALPAPVFHGRRFNGASYPAFALSHTCRLWRCIVMAYPRCWRWIPCTNSHWLAEGLRRSEGALLRVHFDLNYSWNSPAPDLTGLSEQASRIEAVIMGDRHGGPPPFEWETFSTTGVLLRFLRDNEFPAMRELILAQWKNRRHIIDLPPIFLDNTTPLLEHVFISDTNLRPGQAFLQSPLTHFEMARGSPGRSLNDIAEFFKSVPRLEVFIAHHRVWLSDARLLETTTHHPHSIPLPYLRQLRCEGAFEGGLAILNLLALSTRCSASIANWNPYEFRWNRKTDWSVALDILSAHLSAVPAAAMSHSASHIELMYRRLEGDTSPNEAALSMHYVPESSNAEIVSFRIRLYAKDEDDARSFYTSTLRTHLAPHLFGATHTLRVEFANPDYTNPADDLWSSLTEMSAIRALKLAGDAGTLLSKLDIPDHSLRETLPDLRLLTLSRFDFSSEPEVRGRIAALQRDGVALETLRFEECAGVPLEELALLRASAGLVVECENNEE
ncbi:unnamed protein product [Peniophora sp. CBMAI 1063]|nr:unnamed protein product [Peniophora sp. CBMAI 1063]